MVEASTNPVTPESSQTQPEDVSSISSNHLISVACGNSAFLTPDSVDAYNNPSSCHSFYFAQSADKSVPLLSRLSSIDASSGTVVSSFTIPDQAITGIKCSTLNSSLLISCGNTQHLYDTRSNSIVYSFSYSEPILSATTSCSPFLMLPLALVFIRSYSACSTSLVELDIRSFLSFSQVIRSPGRIQSLFSPQPHNVLYTTQHGSSSDTFRNQVLNYADVSDSWTRTGKWSQSTKNDTWWGPATVIQEDEDILFGISGCEGVDLISGTNQNMMWNCRI
mgnify:FL=1